jgi:hypothetical protein
MKVAIEVNGIFRDLYPKFDESYLLHFPKRERPDKSDEENINPHKIINYYKFTGDNEINANEELNQFIINNLFQIFGSAAEYSKNFIRETFNKLVVELSKDNIEIMFVSKENSKSIGLLYYFLADKGAEVREVKTYKNFNDMVLDDSFDYLVTNNNEVIDLYKINNIKTTNYSLIVFNKPFVDQNLISNVEDNEEYDISVLDNFEQLKEFLKNINENKTIQLLN